MDVGFIGLGNMGLPMARRLIEAGHSVVGYDTRPEVLEQAVALGAERGASVKDVADRVETIFASLPTPDTVIAVAQGVAGGSRARRFVDLSTTGSKVSRQVAETLKARNIVAIDSPVSGGVPGAEKGTLAVMVSGPRAEVQPIEPLLARFGRVFFIGEEPGLAQTMKLANNMLSATALAATSEAMVLVAKAGIDPAVAIDVINAGSGHNTATRDKFPRAILPGTFDYGFATALMVKDLRLCMQEADAFGLSMDIARSVGKAFALAQDEIGADKDFTTVVQPLERRAGVTVRARKA
jgi:3-hydroxyisobutyrate dehydrogenase-like beta-hydroxyacid dehydrogenase